MQHKGTKSEIIQEQKIQKLHIDWCFKDEKCKPVCNFIPEVLGIVKVVGTKEKKEFVRLQACFSEGRSEEFIVPLSEVNRIDWFEIDKRCIINSNYKNAKDYLSNVIRTNLDEAPMETRYAVDKLGIYRIGDRVVFNAGNLDIQSSTTTTKLNLYLENSSFCLDIDKELTKIQAFKGMRELIALSPEIGRVLVAHVISGIIRESFREAGFTPCAVLVIVGKSGMLKSHYVPHIAQLYNRADEIRPDTRFNSTQRFIEDILYEHSECTTVIDDLHTAGARCIKQTNETTAEEIIRRISDDTGRGHKEGNALVQKKFRGNVIFIGEYIIGRESTVPRALIVNLTKRIDGKILDKYQRKQPLLVSTFYYFFIQWYVDHFNDICEWISKRLTNFREMTVNSHIHGRLRDTQFYLQISYMIFLEFCRDSGFILQEDVQDEYTAFESFVFKLIQEQQQRYGQNKVGAEGIDYLKLIRRLYRKGKFHLADSADTFREDKHDGLIYYNCLCLRREKLEKKLRKIFPDFKMDDVIKKLVDKKALKRVGEKNTVKISTLSKSEGSHRFYAIWLNMLEE